MPFDPKKCYIPRLYCGNKDDQKYPYEKNDNLYLGKGNNKYCLSTGIGVGLHIENKKKISQASLQNIKYVGPKFAQKFGTHGIHTLDDLMNFIRRSSVNQIKTLLEDVFQNSNNTLNGKGFNSTLLYAYKHGQSRLPSCVDIPAP